MLTQRLEQQARSRNYETAAGSWSRKVADLEEEARTIRQAMQRLNRLAAHEMLPTADETIRP